MKRSRLHPVAQRDIARVRDWYEREQPGLGERFVTAVDDAIGRVVGAPLSFPLIGKETRRARLHPYPYAVLFVVEGDEVFVTGLLHGRRGPRSWSRRVRETSDVAYDGRS